MSPRRATASGGAVEEISYRGDAFLNSYLVVHVPLSDRNYRLMMPVMINEPVNVALPSFHTCGIDGELRTARCPENSLGYEHPRGRKMVKPQVPGQFGQI